MQANSKNLIWLDLEMTGLDTTQDCIIEIATVVTDSELNIIAEGPVLAIFQSQSALSAMDDWNIKHHTRSGLVERVQNSTVTEAMAEAQTIEFLQTFVKPNVSPMCGNSICQDRRFLHRCMPTLEAFFHYRNLDVSTVKELVKRWNPEILKTFRKKSKHIALEDIKESIAELKHYREHFCKLAE